MPKTGPVTNLRTWRAFALAVIVAGAVLEIVVGRVELQFVAPIAILAISLIVSSFCIQGNFWKPGWADADPGLNLVRSLIVLAYSITALALISMAIEAWLGVLELPYLNRMLLKIASGLAILGYYSRKIANRSDAG